ncbi:MAG TPA: iron ABC transporter permease [Methanomicrobia archaeon]|nr:iron ABC transporter permease [Methanomicrobia archaeon]
MTRNQSGAEKGTTGDEIRAQYKRFTARKLIFMVALIVVIVLIAGVAATLGSYHISVVEVYTIIWHGLFRKPETTKELVVWNLRLPAIVMGILAGIGLAIAGTTMQSVVRNPLASPYTLGIASAAGFGAALAIILGRGFAAGQYLIIANAFVFAVLSAFIIYGLSRYRSATPETMILAGIALMYLFSAMTGLLQYFGEEAAVAEVVFWMFGSLGRATWDKLIFVVITLAICIPLLMLKSWDLNTLSAGDESAKSLGVNVDQTRVLCFILASVMTAGVICFTGTIGFIGLVAPHMCRMVIGGDNRYLIPASGLCGAVILLTADTVARRIVAPTILPVGLLTSFLGVPLFLYLILRRKKEYW